MTKTNWKCYHNCGNIISDEFYQKMIQEAKHPPICPCRYYGSINNQPWSLWTKVETLIEPETA